jgi:MYXO-CTERM domain-containing protein
MSYSKIWMWSAVALATSSSWACVDEVDAPIEQAQAMHELMGDGYVDLDEQCDDGNDVAGDGCDPDGDVETGYTCSGASLGSCSDPNAGPLVTFTETAGATLAGAGDFDGPDFQDACGEGEAIVGFDFDLTERDGGLLAPPARSDIDEIRAQCARVKVEAGAVTITETTQTPDRGGSVAATSSLRCASGEVVVGYEAFVNGDDIEGMSLRCAALELVNGSLAVSATRSSTAEAREGGTSSGEVVCPAGQLVTSYTGATDNGGLLQATVVSGFAPRCDTIEDACANTAQTCTPVCGDGLVLPGEACDDDDLDDGDGCSSICEVEPGFLCSGAPSTCTLDADGDGITNDDETARGLDPLDPDSDGDGLCDGAVLVYPGCAGVEDGDGDGVVDAGEGDPLDPDSDDDGVCDGPLGVAGTCDPRPGAPDALACDGRGYYVAGSAGDVSRVDAASASPGFVGLGNTSEGINALAFDPFGGYLYGLTFDASGGSPSLYRIGLDAAGQLTESDLGAITGLPAGDYASGAFAPDGTYVVSGSSGNTQDVLFFIDVNDLALERQVALDDIGYAFGDIAYSTTTGEFVLVDQNTTSIVAVDADSGATRVAATLPRGFITAAIYFDPFSPQELVLIGDDSDTAAAEFTYATYDFSSDTLTTSFTFATPDFSDAASCALPDVDLDGLLDQVDPDDDDDGVSDANESGGVDPSGDSDGDGVPDWADSDQPGFLDANMDGVDDRLDLDGDGIPNHRDVDSDGDGLGDGDEDADGDGAVGAGETDPLDPDSDDDGVDDGAEVGAGSDPLDPCDPDSGVLVCPTGDPDGDGVDNQTEVIAGTDPNDPDSDDDGVCDGVIDVAPTCVGGGTDADGDGIPAGIDPDDADPCNPNPDALACPTGDPDGDGVNNGDEATAGTDPSDPDSDDDGLCDGALSLPGVCVGQGGDDDGDGVTNDAEVGAGSDPLDPCDPDPDALACPTGDPDGDGVNNGDEATAGTDPNDPDSDDDGICDGAIDVTPVCIGQGGDADLDGVDNVTDPAPLDPCNPNPDALACPTGDPDGDGATNAQERGAGTDLQDPDSDDDGVCDGPNTVVPTCIGTTGDEDGDGVLNATDPDPLDPCNPNPNALACPTGDPDGDGVNNGDEATAGTDPNDPDSDDDGLCDGALSLPGVCVGQGGDDDGDGVTNDAEVGAGSDPLDPCDPDPNALACPTGDPDGDGVDNQTEAIAGTDPNDPDSDDDGTCDGVIDVAPTCVGAGTDADGDGIPVGTDPDDADPCNPNPDALACPTGDPDGDGVNNGDEATAGTDPNDPDSDDDGVCDGMIDVVLVCVGGGADGDGDGVPVNLDPDDADPCNPNPDALACPTGDTDGDGVDNLTEGATGTDPNDPDSDDDGTCDGVIDVAGVCTGQGMDGDGDGVPTGTDPDDADPCNPNPDALTCPTGDPDGDGVNNGDEATAGTDPLDPDSDDDGVLDADEIGADPTNPRDTDDDGEIDALDQDDDGDGILTGVERADSAALGDDDVDGTPGVNWLDADADGDGIEDGVEGRFDIDGDNVPAYLDPDETGANLTLDSPTQDELLGDGAISIVGTTRPSADVTITVRDAAGDVVYTATVTADSNGAYTDVTDELPDGPYSVTATAAVGEATQTRDVVVDTVADPTSITSPADGARSADATPTISGVAEAGAQVEVSVDGAVVATVVAGDDGAWSYTLSDDEALAEGEHTLSATATDAAGNTAQADPVSYEVDLTAPAVTVETPAAGASVSGDLSITGTADPGAQVVVVIDGVEAATVTADDQGAWSYTPDEPLAAGDHTVEASSTDDVGNEGSSGVISFTVTSAESTLTITSPGEGDVITDDEVVVRGTAAPGAEVTVEANGASTTVTAGEDGAWEATVTVSQGDNLVTASSGDQEASLTFTGDLPADEDDLSSFALSGGGCSSTPGGSAPADTSLVLLALGLLFIRRRR